MTQDTLFTATVSNLNSQGQGICTLDGLKVFVDFAGVGETITAKIIEKKKNYAVAKLVDIPSPSKDRIEPICPLFGRCGGCQVMHLNEKAQLEFKQKKVQEAFDKIAKLNVEVEACVPSIHPLYYRNKIQMPFFYDRNKCRLGLYQKNSHTPIEVKKCFIHCALGQEVLDVFSKLIEEAPFKVYDEVKRQGQLRHFLVRSAIATKQCLVTIVVFDKKQLELFKQIADELMTRCPSVKGVVLNVNKKRLNAILGHEWHLLAGSSFIEETLLAKTFKISAHSFFQVNPKQAENLYQTALEKANIQPHETVLDAYCGTGTLSLLAARFAKKVMGIEVVESAIKDARANAEQNQVTNCQFIQGKVEESTKHLASIDVAMINPPRRGCERIVLETLGKTQPRAIIYISCDPATLARDVSLLKAFGYHPSFVKPFDMFPQTAHVETCALLTLQK